MYKKLRQAIKDHSNLEDSSIRDAGNYGADGGFSGFIHYEESYDFYDNNKTLIHEFCQSQAEDLGYKNWMSMFAEFNRADMLEQEDGFKVLAGWFVLEEVGRWLEDNRFYEAGWSDGVESETPEEFETVEEAIEWACKQIEFHARLADDLSDDVLTQIEEEIIELETNNEPFEYHRFNTKYYVQETE